MTQNILIDPVTRIEGHATISIHLNDAGEVEDTFFHVNQLRGFETLAKGRPFREMPSLMARICGICSVSHMLASAKACDELLAVRIPEAAVKLRKLLNYAQIVQSHALSFFYLSSPDLLLGMDADPKVRNIFGVLQAAPEFARNGIRLRQFGQEIIEKLSRKRIHSAWVVAGGVNRPMDATTRDSILAEIPDLKRISLETLAWFRAALPAFREEIRAFASFPTLFLGLVSAENTLEFYDGWLRIMDAQGRVVDPSIPPQQYAQAIGEAVESYSYLKSPYYLPAGYPDGIYRVGPLARLHLVERCGTPLADAELEAFRQIDPLERQSSFYYHYARLIELLHGLEQIESLLHAPDILSPHVQAVAGPNVYEGVGISEAPRGTLIHHYWIDENGLMQDLNLIVATGHNNLAMNRGIRQTAQHFVHGSRLSEGILNRVEAVIRTFDPCLSCATHAFGQMPLHIQLIDAQGAVLDEARRV